VLGRDRVRRSKVEKADGEAVAVLVMIALDSLEELAVLAIGVLGEECVAGEKLDVAATTRTAFKLVLKVVGRGVDGLEKASAGLEIDDSGDEVLESLAARETLYAETLSTASVPTDLC
jgi:hypothetical protein